MELIESLQVYTNAQKAVGTYFILTGIGLFIIAIITYFNTSVSLQLNNGLRLGTLICGLLILIGGFAYRNFSSKIESQQLEVYLKSKDDFVKTEAQRMNKVVNDYPKYQIVFGSFIILSLTMVWILKSPFWNGIAFSIIILFTSIMIIEAFSEDSIKNYHIEIQKQK